MVSIIRTAWSGTSGGPGLTQLAVDQNTPAFGPLTAAEGQAAVNAVRAFWFAIAASLPDEVALTVSPVVDTYLDNNGTLAWSMSAATAPATVSGTSTAIFSMATGPKLNLNTGVIRNGRRVRGSVYIVPGGGNCQASNGMCAAATKTAFNSAAATMMASLQTAGLNLRVWSRPLKDSAGNITRDGVTNPVSVVETNEKLAILRGRRD